MQWLYKNGKIVSVKVVVNEHRQMLVRGSEKDTFPLSQSSWTLTRCSFSLTVKRVKGWSGDCELYLLFMYPTHQTLVLKKTNPFLWFDAVVIPRNQSVLSPTSTSQQCVPELKPSEPRTHGHQSNLSGLRGRFWYTSLNDTLVRSAETVSQRPAVFGSRVNGAAKRIKSD